MPTAYLSVEEARDRLFSTGNSVDVTSVDDLTLGLLLESFEIMLDSWLGYRAAVTQYSEWVRTDNYGVGQLANYPVISVSGVELPQDQIVGRVPPAPVPAVNTVWDRFSVLSTGRARIPFGSGYAAMTVRTTYTAGYDPVPPLFKLVVFNMLQAAVKSGQPLGDVSFLSDPVRDVSSISLPGGLSKSFRLGAASSGGGGETQLDRLLKPLSPYRRIFTL